MNMPMCKFLAGAIILTASVVVISLLKGSLFPSAQVLTPPAVQCQLSQGIPEGTAENLKCVLGIETAPSCDSPVELLFTLVNLSDQPVYILNWGTPFEGTLTGDYLLIEHDGSWLPYHGKLVSRVAPTRCSYLKIAPRGRISTNLTINDEDYPVGKGAYCVTFKGMLYDIVNDEEQIPVRVGGSKRSASIRSNTISFVVQ